MTVIFYLRSHLKTEIVNPVGHHLLKRDSYTGFDSVKMRSHLRLNRESDTVLTITV